MEEPGRSKALVEGSNPSGGTGRQLGVVVITPPFQGGEEGFNSPSCYLWPYRL